MFIAEPCEERELALTLAWVCEGAMQEAIASYCDCSLESLPRSFRHLRADASARAYVQVIEPRQWYAIRWEDDITG